MTIRSAFLLLILLCPRLADAQLSTLYLTDAPAWLHYFCDSSEADPNGSVAAQGAHCYQNLTVPSGATLTVTGKNSFSRSPQNVPIGAFLAYVAGTCSIAGTINAASIITSNGNGGGVGGGGGGGSTTAGSNGADSDIFGSASVTRVAAGAVGGAVGQTGGGGTSPQPSSQKAIWGRAFILGSLGGSYGGKGGGGANGGSGGGGVVLVCGAISFTGAINVSGGNGSAGGAGVGGGGGGGGGIVLIASPNYQADSGSINVNGGLGGLGGSGAGSGGNGANGWSKQFFLQ